MTFEEVSSTAVATPVAVLILLPTDVAQQKEGLR